MMTVQQIATEIARVTYKPGWTFEVGNHPLEGPTLSIVFAVPNAYRDGEQQVQRVNSPIPPTRSASELHDWLMWRLHRIEAHEMCEFYKIDGQMRLDPHDESYWFIAPLVYPSGPHLVEDHHHYSLQDLENMRDGK